MTFSDTASLYLAATSYLNVPIWQMLSQFHHLCQPSFSSATQPDSTTFDADMSKPSFRHGHRHDTETYNYTELCDFLKLLVVSVFVSCLVSMSVSVLDRV